MEDREGSPVTVVDLYCGEVQPIHGEEVRGLSMSLRGLCRGYLIYYRPSFVKYNRYSSCRVNRISVVIKGRRSLDHNNSTRYYSGHGTRQQEL